MKVDIMKDLEQLVFMGRIRIKNSTHKDSLLLDPNSSTPRNNYGNCEFKFPAMEKIRYIALVSHSKCIAFEQYSLSSKGMCNKAFLITY